MASKKEKPENGSVEEVTGLEGQARLAALAPELENGVSAADELEGTWDKEKSPVICGEVSHGYCWETKPDDNGEVKTVRGVALVTRHEVMASDNGGSFPVQSGKLVGVTVSEKLSVLAYQRQGDVVAIEYLGKANLRGGRTCGRYRMRASENARETMMPFVSRSPTT